MTGPGRRFDPGELRPTGNAGDAQPSDAELADALVMARELEARAGGEPLGAPRGGAEPGLGARVPEAAAHTEP